jgi:homoserine O-acetyltransferase/O-succinyltransferase
VSEPTEHEFRLHEPFVLDGGERIRLTLRYSVWGEPAPDGANVVWVCHALTGSPRVEQWWPGLVGAGRFYDPAQLAIICVNVPGSCYGSTGPLSENEETGRPYFHSFPVFTARDVARAFEGLAQALGFSQLHTVIGGSMGGQHALEWAVQYPDRMKHLVLLCSNASQSPWAIAFDAAQRQAIELDPTWNTDSPDAGLAGMQVARSIAMLSYRAYANYSDRQHDAPDRPLLGPYRAESYQRYQGLKLTQRFNAFTYYRMTQLLDSHDVGLGRGGCEIALGSVRAKTLVVGVEQDLLFPLPEQRYLAQHIPGAQLAVIDSPFGHDAFLVEFEALAAHLRSFHSHIPQHTF